MDTNLSIWDNTVDYASCEVFCKCSSFQRKNVHHKIIVVWPSHIVVIQKTVGNGFIGNSAVTLRGTLPTFSIQQKSVYLYMSNTTIMKKCMSCDINFKSQEHFKNLGTAVEIMSVHTDLHRQMFQSRVSTKFPGHCLQSELWFKCCVKRVSCWQKWNSNWCNFLRLYMFSLLLETFHMRHIKLLLFRDAPAVKLHSKIYNPWDLMPLDITYITVKNTLSWLPYNA